MELSFMQEKGLGDTLRQKVKNQLMLVVNFRE